MDWSLIVLEMTYNRLLSQLLEYSEQSRRGVPSAHLKRLEIAIFADAWSIVDWIHRLYRALLAFPGLRNIKSICNRYHIFEKVDSTNSRNYFQHMEAILKGNLAAETTLETVYWIYTWNENPVEYAHLLISDRLLGPFQPGEAKEFSFRLPPPEGHSVSVPIGFVHLMRGDEFLNFSELAAQLPAIAADLDGALAALRPDNRSER